MTPLRLLPILLLLPACEALRERLPGGSPGTAAPVPAVAPVPRPPADARTAEAFDTTTEAERVAATTAAQEPDEEALGTTVASLGDPADPGLWLETPLVAEARPGRISLPGSDQSVLVELRPITGPATAGSRISLPAIRLLGASLAGLPEIEVYAR